MSIVNRFYCLQVKNFFREGLTEHACAASHDNLSLWYQYEDAIKSIQDNEPTIERMGYKLVNSGTGDSEDSSVLYWCRYENPSGRAIVFEVFAKHIEGLPVGEQYII